MDIDTRKKILTGLYVTIITSGVHTRMELLDTLCGHTEGFLKEKYQATAPLVVQTYREIHSVITNISVMIARGYSSDADKESENYHKITELIRQNFVITDEWNTTIAAEVAKGANEFSLLNRARAAAIRAVPSYAEALAGNSSELSNAIISINESMDCLTKIFSNEEILDENFDREFRKNISAKNTGEKTISMQSPVKIQ